MSIAQHHPEQLAPEDLAQMLTEVEALSGDMGKS
jgi:hypothetical protein